MKKLLTTLTALALAAYLGGLLALSPFLLGGNLNMLRWPYYIVLFWLDNLGG